MDNKIDVLKNCTIEGNVVKLPNVQLDRKLYQEVAKSLELIGGKWKGGKIFGFVFNSDPTDLLDEIANEGKRNLKKEFQFFPTPEKLADKLVSLAEIKENQKILEPSAGQGAIIKAINKVTKNIPDCFELMKENIMILNKSVLNFNIIGEDFLTTNKEENKYDRIIANPPFSKNQDIDHFMEMYKCLKFGGRIVCIVSSSWYLGNQKKQIEFKNFLKENKANIIDVEEGAFKESGTMVKSKIIVLDKPIKNNNNNLSIKIENWKAELEFCDNESERKAIELLIKINVSKSRIN